MNNSKGAVLAYVDVEFDGVLVSKGWRLFEGREGRKFDLGLPSEPDKAGKKDEKTGQTKWWPTVWIDVRTDDGRKLMDAIKDFVFKKYEGAGGGKAEKAAEKKAEKKGGGAYEDDDIPF